MMVRHLITVAVLVILICSSPTISYPEPVRRVNGVVTEVGDGFIWFIAENQSEPKKYLLPWKTRFIPPKLPLKGDHATILYKVRKEGLVVYGLEYSTSTSEPKDSVLDFRTGKDSK